MTAKHAFSKIRRLLLLAVLPAVLAACAATPSKPEWRARSDQLLEQQLRQVDEALSRSAPSERVDLYLGFAMHSQSRAFQGDVLLGKRVFSQMRPALHSVVLSNDARTSGIEYPFATLASMQRVFERANQWTKERKARVVVLVSTHGHVDLLSVNIANRHWPALRSKQLKEWLDMLGDADTAVILSACYAGSFIDSLKSDNRVILTAAAADRTSFGCHPLDTNTYFIDALLREPVSPTATWTQLFEGARQRIEMRERNQGIDKSSNPQIYLGQTITQRNE